MLRMVSVSDRKLQIIVFDDELKLKFFIKFAQKAACFVQLLITNFKNLFRNLPRVLYYFIRCKKHLTHADVAELVDALDLGSSIFDVKVRVVSSAF
jgi:hypothetical protein